MQSKKFKSKFEVVWKLQLLIGSQSLKYAEEVDDHRLRRQGRCNFSSTKEARKAWKNKLIEQNAYYEEAEDYYMALESLISGWVGTIMQFSQVKIFNAFFSKRDF